MRIIALVLVVAMLVLGPAPSAWAHAVETNFSFDLISRDLVFVSTFSTGEPLGDAEVEVFAPNNAETPWLVGTTDEAGRFSFLPDQTIPGDWKLEVHREGHSNIVIIPVGATGLEFNNITQTPGEDVHYASGSWVGVAAIALGALFMALIARLRPTLSSKYRKLKLTR